MIPKDVIRREHILKAIQEVQIHGIPPKRLSKKFLLAYGGKHYPPKYIVSLANKYVKGSALNPDNFSGGAETNGFLSSLGFNIVEGQSTNTESPAKLHGKRGSSGEVYRHNERCPKCKESIKKLLAKAYGEINTNHRFEIGTHLEDFKNSPYYNNLREIYFALQRHRGFTDFVKAKNLPNCDFFVPDPGFILEFDESQHFTRQRAISLKNYPLHFRVGFDKGKWIERCMKLKAEDNDPPYRDEQRAWYDTLRDFCSLIINTPTIRLLPDEAMWCNFDDSQNADVERFKQIIEQKLNNYYADNSTKKNFVIGLAFPELNEHDLPHYCKVIKQTDAKFDLLVFPEGFESIKPNKDIKPESISEDHQIKELIKKYVAASKQYKTAIIVGVQVDYSSTLTSGGDNDQYCMVLDPKGDVAMYHKHSTSRHNAFYDSNWSIGRSFRVARINETNVGVSICHDSYISLIPRVLKKKGAEVWVNISYQNVRPTIWEAVHQTRAVENGFVAICTLHRNRHAPNPQKEPYAFSKKGKIKLIDSESGEAIDSIPFHKRAGRIYYFDINKYQTYPSKSIDETDLPRNADRLLVTSSSKIQTTHDSNNFVFKVIDIQSFLHAPEILWRSGLDSRPRIPFFIIHLKNRAEWNTYQEAVMKVIKGRTIEFSTLFLFVAEDEEILLGAYRSSNYKDCRLFYPGKFPFEIDKRYLKGLQSTFKISLDDYRNDDDTIYFQKIHDIIDFILQPS
jgi:hypothetical protein